LFPIETGRGIKGRNHGKTAHQTVIGASRKEGKVEGHSKALGKKRVSKGEAKNKDKGHLSGE